MTSSPDVPSQVQGGVAPAVGQLMLSPNPAEVNTTTQKATRKVIPLENELR